MNAMDDPAANAPGLPQALSKQLGESHRAGKREFLGIGLSWSLLRARVTGQVEVD